MRILFDTFLLTKANLIILAFEVVQVRLIFQAILRDEATSLEAFREPLAYVQYFAFTSHGTNMGY